MGIDEINGYKLRLECAFRNFGEESTTVTADSLTSDFSETIAEGIYNLAAQAGRNLDDWKSYYKFSSNRIEEVLKDPISRNLVDNLISQLNALAVDNRL